MEKLRIFVDFSMSAEVLELLRSGMKGHQLMLPQNPSASVLTQSDHDPQFATADVAFGQPATRAIAEAPRLKWVHVSSSGITRYDTPEFRALATQRKIILSNSATVYAEPCAAHALSFILAQARQLPVGLKTRAVGGTPAWHAVRGACRTLRGESVLIVGYGAIGKRLVELLQPFDMKIIAYHRRARGDEAVPVLRESELPGALSEADHVMNILPQSKATDHFFNAARFASMKRGAIFYNIGRGSTVDQTALLQALRSGGIAAAWLDVTEPEPLPDDHPLWAEPNCFITPHVAGGHADEAKTLVRHFLNNLERFVRGEPLLDRVL